MDHIQILQIHPENNDDKCFQYAATLFLSKNWKRSSKNAKNFAFNKQLQLERNNIKSIRKSLKQMIKQLLLISYMYHTIAKK